MNAAESMAPESLRPADDNTHTVPAVEQLVAQISDPTVTACVNVALQRLALTQSLATAIQDAVSDLRAHTTVQLAAFGGAAARLIHTGDVKTWREAVEALNVGTQQSQQRLESLIALATRELSPTNR